MFDLLTNGTVLQGRNDQYRILGVIGRGGMGAVYRGERLSDSSIWAVKEMRPPLEATAEEVAENRKLFEQEAQMLATLKHPNLPKVVDYFEQGGRPYLVMEYIQGKTLEDKQRDMNAPFFQEDVINWGVQIARVLHYLHSQQPPIIFRDMKPPNVMLTPESVIKLIDFGVARTYKATKSKDTVAMGSAGYAPPEQYGKGQTDARSDVYGLGATLLHLLTNLPPVPLQPPQPGSVIRHNQSVTQQMEQALIKAMALRQEDRYQSMHAFEQALLACAKGPIDLPTEQGPVFQAPPQPQRRPQPQVQPQRQPQPQPAYQPPQPQPPQPPSQPRAGGWHPVTPGQQQQPWTPPQPPAWTAPPQPGGPTCNQCGRVNKPQARFCSGCGARLEHPVPKLVISSPRAVWEVKLHHLPCQIGRRDPAQNHHPEIDLAEHDRGIASRRHALIQKLGDRYTLVDLGSVNGTSINGIPMSANQPHTLRSGDRIRIGDVEMVFSMD